MNKKELKKILTKKKNFLHRTYAQLSFSLLYYSVIATGYNSLNTYHEENIPKSPFIVCSNHSSHADSVMLMFALRKGTDDFYLLAAQDYWFRKKILVWVARQTFNMIPVNRNIKDEKSFSFEDTVEVMEDLAQQRKNFIMYPEGGRVSSSKDQRLRPFKSGAARFSIILDIPIVPAFVGGSMEAMGKGSFFVKPGSRYDVLFGQPVDPKDYSRPRQMMAIVEERVKLLQKKFLEDIKLS